MRAHLVVFVAFAVIGATGCKKNRDPDAQKWIDDMGKLDDAVVDTLEAKPNEEGVVAAEALVAAESRKLHDRLAEIEDAELSADAQVAISNACVKNAQMSRVARDYVANAVLSSNPSLLGRATRLAGDLCATCSTDAHDGSLCAAFATK